MPAHLSNNIENSKNIIQQLTNIKTIKIVHNREIKDPSQPGIYFGTEIRDLEIILKNKIVNPSINPVLSVVAYDNNE